MINIKIIIVGIKAKMPKDLQSKENLLLYAFYISLIVLLLLSSVSKAMLVPSFSFTIFLYIGALSRILSDKKKVNANNFASN
jgi:hypothetical protein